METPELSEELDVPSPSPPFLHSASNQKTGGVEGLGMRLDGGGRIFAYPNLASPSCVTG